VPGFKNFEIGSESESEKVTPATSVWCNSGRQH